MRREEREAGFSIGQHEVHPALRHADRRPVPGDDHQGRVPAHAPGLAHGQGPRQNLHARAIAPRRTAAPDVIGVDEISIRKGHTYRIVVSDLEKKRAIWFGGEGRTQADMDRFYAYLGKENAKKIRLAVMDMWKPFRKSTQQHAPQAAIVFDKFHVLRHLSDALDGIRRAEYKRVTGDDRTFIKGQRYVLLSRRENLSDGGRQNLERLLQANARLNVAYLLREQFEQLWSYTDAGDARSFFDNWRTNCRDRTSSPTKSSPA